MEKNRTAASLILERSRQTYPEHAFIVIAQGPDRKIDFATNIIPEDVGDFLQDCLGIVHGNKLEREPTPKI